MYAGRLCFRLHGLDLGGVLLLDLRDAPIPCLLQLLDLASRRGRPGLDDRIELRQLRGSVIDRRCQLFQFGLSRQDALAFAPQVLPNIRGGVGTE